MLIVLLLAITIALVAYIVFQRRIPVTEQPQEALAVLEETVEEELLVVLEETVESPIALEETVEAPVILEETVEAPAILAESVEEEPLVDFEEPIEATLFDNPEIWSNPDMTVTELAKIIGTNRTYLWKQIKDMGYESYTDLINRKRVDYICKELKKGTDQSLISLMFDAGFRSRSTANREFKRIMGCTPSEYLKNQGEMNQGEIP